MNGNYPADFGQRDWSHVNGEDLVDEDEEEFDPSTDDGGYSQGDSE